MAGRVALHSVDTAVFRVFLRSTTANVEFKRNAGGNATTSVPPGSLRTEADLPVITLPTMLYRLIFKGYYNQMHKLQLYEKQLYGPMYKVPTGKDHAISLNSVELLEELMRKDDKFPRRADMNIWTEYRDKNNLGYGPFTEFTTAILEFKRKTGGNAASSVPPGSLRTDADLPVITLPTMLYRMIFKGYYNQMHELQLYEKKLYGSMYKVQTGNNHAISLNSVELLEELMRKDDKFPRRADMNTWTEYRDKNNLGYGPVTEEGEKWYKLRSVLNKRMLHPKDSLKYENVVNEVVTDFIKRICHLRKMSSTGDLVPNISNELYRFTLEGISRILFETRIGCLENEIPAETQNFIDSIAQMFTYTMVVNLLPKWTRNYSPLWWRFTSAWDGIFKFACKLIDRKMEDIQMRLDAGQEVAGEYLSYLLSNTNMSKKDVYGSVTELLLAGVDTTSNTMMWALYQLSQYPKIQDTLYQEVNNIIKGDKIPTAEDITNMPYLKAVIKETLRIYPVVSTNARLLSENDVIIGGHFFPKKTNFLLNHYAISHDETVFPQPKVFKPERWLRDGRERPVPFGSIPFGFGVRGCVGKRIAELEMHLALARIIKRFKVKLDPNVREVKALSRSMLVADRTVNFHFLERKDVPT
ncbi:sterol 26-hydroxylase, mitochondrial [Silurus asotus]|uniref:Sterol 26-hydroxylase, mitochondrial n=1 Tax=Silurus asotus TaxID=30991 RepID=A0AAD5AVJ9_SILAS|nr:sterol 26-hydroxylase, mitochondrial [Silurus asotus]